MDLHVTSLVDDLTDLIVDVLGTGVRLRGPARLVAEVRGLLTDLAPATEPDRQLELVEEPGGTFQLLDDGALVRAGIARAVAAPTIVWRLNAVAATTTRHLVVHAGCVAGEGGVLLPGASGTGKSTLTAACIAEGMAYLSDEYAALDLADGTLTPYAKPLGLDGDRLVSASVLTPGSVGRSGPPSGIVFPRYAPGAVATMGPLDPGWTLLALAAHTTNLAALGGAALPWLAGLALACPSWQVTYGNTAAGVGAVRDAARRPGSAVRPAVVLEPITASSTTVVMGDEVAVLDERTGQVHLLNASAACVWTCVPDASDARDLLAVARKRAPLGSLDESMIVRTVEHLTRSGLLSAWAPP